MKTNEIFKIITAGASNLFKPQYLRAVAKTTLDWDASQRKGAIKTISLYSLLKQPLPVQMSMAPVKYGESPVMDVLSVATLASLTSPRAIFEIGTFTGLTTLSLAMNTPEDAHIWTLDLPPAERPESEREDSMWGSCWRGTRFEERITQLYVNSKHLDTTPYAKKMDFIFVDAVHEYDFVVSDSAKAFEMLAPGGVVVWHDYARGFPGVQKCLNEIAQNKTLYHIEGTQVVVYREGGF